MLPDIDFAIPESGRTFLEKISKTAESLGTFGVDLHFDARLRKGWHVLNLRYHGPSEHTAPGAQLLIEPDQVGRVHVELRAERWCPDPPTRASYADLAKMLIDPLLQAYNRSEKAHCRLRIEKLRRAQPPLPPQAAAAFERFMGACNKALPHVRDWERFYEFIRVSRREIPEEVMTSLLVKGGFSRERADSVAGIYRHVMAYKLWKSKLPTIYHPSQD